MNLSKLFEMQKKLDDHIIENHKLQGVDLLSNKILALQVELGDLANCWRGFKHWSNDQKPRRKQKVMCKSCNGTGDANNQASLEMLSEGHDGYEFDPCTDCNATGYLQDKDPLLEEYVDCLHFILSIGLSQNMQVHSSRPAKCLKLIDQFNHSFVIVSKFFERPVFYGYQCMWEIFLGLGEMLDLTWNEIEQAYYAKNAVNHNRQVNGY